MTEFTNEEEEEKYYIQYELFTLWDTNNGLTLCIDCYDIYDALLCCIKATTTTTTTISNGSDSDKGYATTTNTTTAVTATSTIPVTTTYTILVSSVLKSHPIFSDKLSRLDGTSVALPERMFMNRWPSVVLLQYRENMYNKYMLENHPLEVTLPHECTHCGLRTKTEVRLASHMRSKACLGTATTATTAAADTSTDCRLPPTLPTSTVNATKPPALGIFTVSTSSHPTLPATATASTTIQAATNILPPKQRRSRGKKKKSQAVETAIKPS